MAERIALFGGSFDPVHFGHLIVARAIAERLDLDRVILLPSGSPPHKEADALADAEHRAEMVELAIAGEPVFGISDFDRSRSGPSYTIDTVRHFRDRFGPDARLYWIIGADSLAELSTWRRVGELVEACEIVTAARPALPRRAPKEADAWGSLRDVLSDAQIVRLKQGELHTPLIDISSTEIRNRVTAGRSIRYFVPDAVADYINRHRLYRRSSA